MRKLLLVVLLAFPVGCERKNTVEIKIGDGPAIKVDAKKAAEGFQKQKDDEQALIEQLAKDQEPLKVQAAKAVYDALAKHEGDKVAEVAEITPEEVETFGGEKWVVTGKLHCVRRDGTDSTTKFEVTLRVAFGKLQTMRTRLDVDPPRASRPAPAKTQADE